VELTRGCTVYHSGGAAAGIEALNSALALLQRLILQKRYASHEDQAKDQAVYERAMPLSRWSKRRLYKAPLSICTTCSTGCAWPSTPGELDERAARPALHILAPARRGPHALALRKGRPGRPWNYADPHERAVSSGAAGAASTASDWRGRLRRDEGSCFDQVLQPLGQLSESGRALT